MRSTLLYYIMTMLLVTAIVAVAVFWTHLSHVTWYDEGPILWIFWSTHGIHTFDLVVFGVELLLVLLLSVTLLAGFSRRR